jgi:hypothetical protein
MAEDSGTFKTNPAKSLQFRHFVITRQHRCNQASPAEETDSGTPRGHYSAELYQPCGIFEPA